MINDKKDKGDVILYTTEDNKIKMELKVFNETVWLTQKEISELFQTTTQNITQHIKDIYETFELEELATCKNCNQLVNITYKFNYNNFTSGKLVNTSNPILSQCLSSAKGLKLIQYALSGCQVLCSPISLYV